MGLESTTKQELMRKHIKDVVERKQREIGLQYEEAKERYIESAGERRKAIRAELAEILDRARTLSEEYEAVKKRLGYRTYHHVEVPEIDENELAATIALEFDNSMGKVRRQAEDELDDARLRATSNVLFADEKRLREEVDRISNLKMNFEKRAGDSPASPAREAVS